MKHKRLLTRVSVSGLLLAGLALVGPDAQAGKPMPPPASPPAIVYSRSDGIYTMSVEGSSQKCILPDSRKVSYWGASFSPNGKEIAFYRSTGTVVDLCRANSDGTGLVALHSFISSTDLPDDNIIWSPDGTKLLFTLASHAEDLLYIELASPGVIKAVPVDVVPNGTGLAISKDLDPVTPGYQGKAALAAYYEDENDPYYHPLIAILDLTFDASGAPQLGTDVEFILTGDGPSRLAWSPQGDMLAYSGTPVELLPTRLHMLTLAWESGSYLDFVVDPGLVYANQRIVWSPDGRYLAYGRTGGYNDIFRATIKVDANGVPALSEMKNLTNTPKWTSESNPDWSPVWVPSP